MNDHLQTDLSRALRQITDIQWTNMLSDAAPVLSALKEGLPAYRDSLGWLDPVWISDEWRSRIRALATEMQNIADKLVVTGVGGSNQAARAVYEALEKKQGMRLVWAGNSLSAYEINRVLEEIKDGDFCVNIIAKNFETLEPGVAFRTLRSTLKARYGSEYAKRIVCTGTEGSSLETLALTHGWRFLPFPADTGGRFSAFSPVALFPLAAAGFDIDALAKGAAGMRERLFSEAAGENTALRHAVLRNHFYEQGFRMEMLSFFEPRLARFSLWWRQLFAESEGKEEKGLYPVCGNFSEDLHSVGQFLQDGSRILFETFLDVEDSASGLLLPSDDIRDGFSYLDGKDFDEMNRTAFEATFLAHASVLPCLRLTVPRIDEAAFGELFYYFFFVCTLSALLLKVNPFDQPGVEAYKAHMFRALGKGKENGDETYLSESETV